MEESEDMSGFAPAVLFIRQQHADILKGLHAEIEELKHKCSGLQFQMELKYGANPEEENLEDYASIYHDLQNQLKEKDEQNEEWRWKHTQLINQLKTKNAHIKLMKKELEDKAATIAFLSTELHKVTLGLSAHELEELHLHSEGKARSLDDETTSLPDTSADKDPPGKLRRIRSSYNPSNRAKPKKSLRSEAELPDNYKSSVASLPPIKNVVRHQLRVEPVLDMATLAIDNHRYAEKSEQILQKESWSF